MTNYIFHRTRRDHMRGDTLYPLNELPEVYPDLYEAQAKKYEGREHTMQNRIPILDGCLWNDVLFFTSVRPQDLMDARRKAGWQPDGFYRYFKIDPSKLDQSRLGVFLFKTTADSMNYTAEDYTEYRYEDLESYSQVPDATVEYYKQELEAGQPRPRLFYKYIPHILYRGSIDVSDTEIITVTSE